MEEKLTLKYAYIPLGEVERNRVAVASEAMWTARGGLAVVICHCTILSSTAGCWTRFCEKKVKWSKLKGNLKKKNAFCF